MYKKESTFKMPSSSIPEVKLARTCTAGLALAMELSYWIQPYLRQTLLRDHSVARVRRAPFIPKESPLYGGISGHQDSAA